MITPLLLVVCEEQQAFVWGGRVQVRTLRGSTLKAGRSDPPQRFYGSGAARLVRRTALAMSQ